jgi:AcrR family transcriptional regulator
MALQRTEAASVALSRDRVCREALALVDQEGLAALTMRRLGARLGVEAMSLYRHVHDKADLLDALHAAVLGDLQPEGVAGDDWRALLGGLARALRSALLRHPHVLPLFVTRPVRAPEARATLERIDAALARAGFAAATAARAVHVVGMFTIGQAIFDAAGLQRTADRADRYGHPARHSLAGDASTRSARLADERLRAACFRFGLDALLDGIERAHRRHRHRLSRRTR